MDWPKSVPCKGVLSLEPWKILVIADVRYINILTWFRGFQVKLQCLVLFSLYPSLLWELRDKINLKILPF